MVRTSKQKQIDCPCQCLVQPPSNPEGFFVQCVSVRKQLEMAAIYRICLTLCLFGNVYFLFIAVYKQYQRVFTYFIAYLELFSNLFKNMTCWCTLVSILLTIRFVGYVGSDETSCDCREMIFVYGYNIVLYSISKILMLCVYY